MLIGRLSRYRIHNRLLLKGSRNLNVKRRVARISRAIRRLAIRGRW